MLPSKFWSKTAIDTGCVLWIGAVNSKGYGCFAVAGVSKLAHRVVWEDTHGPIPDELQLDHLCRVRNCVNVDHLELVSASENQRRKPVRIEVGGECPSGHPIGSTGDLYISPKRRTAECRACRRELSRSRRRAVA